ncbi:MAG: DUF2268 domain-containing protein [Bacillus sp. (in: Bacteria)]|nr:DUF2268 domain-containing protein [Bacillus sp. (in: firmicutes)]
MGIIRTDEWLQQEFDRPAKIAEKLMPFFNDQTPNEIYNLLKDFGMYRPSRSTRNHLNTMIDQKAWDMVEQLFDKYKKKWNGPDIPVFLFPLAQSRGLFMKAEKSKAGVSFPDKMFLFLTHYEDPKEIEALLVHEYHHVCRLQMLNKSMADFTLLDSIIIEGLAEFAVIKNCGQKYLANWCRMYSEQEISKFWVKYLKKQLDKKKSERAHDELLYGGGRIPNLLGYAVGFTIVENFYKSHNYSTKLSFTNPAVNYLEEYNDFNRKKPIN